MDTYTIAAAARLVGTPKAKLYQAIRAGNLQPVPAQESATALTVTAAALQAAGFAVPAETLQHPTAIPETAPAPEAEAAPAPDVAETRAAAEPVLTPPSASALIAHLERALEQAHARELRLLDVLAQLTSPRSTPLEPEPPAMPEASGTTAPPTAIPAPLGGLRQQIVEVLRKHPEGLSPKAVQMYLQMDKDVRSTMKGMVHSGLLTRLAVGQYVVTASSE